MTSTAERRVAMSLLAHPDDAEILCAGTLIRLADAGCDGALVATALHTGRIGQSSASASRQVADCP